MAPPLDPDAFDEADPAAFYLLGDGRADMEALADATLVVAGKRLPAHRSVLSLQSGVLRGLFADLRSGSSSKGSAGFDLKGDGQDEGLVLEAPFQDATLFHASLFLRFCYHLEDRTPANLGAALSSLPGLLRLAHRLDAPQIQQAVCESMAELAPEAEMPQLLKWVAAAGGCQLPELRLHCLSELARRLASGPSSVSRMAADSALLTDACRDGMLTPAAVVKLVAVQADMMRRTANPGSLEWALERYSEQPSGMIGQAVCSPWISAAGKRWRLKVFPGGINEECAGCLSVFIESDLADPAGTRAKCTLTLVDQAAEGPQHISHAHTEPKTFTNNSRAWGFGDFATHQQLRARPGFLAGDRLVLRARVEVVP